MQCWPVNTPTPLRQTMAYNFIQRGINISIYRKNSSYVKQHSIEGLKVQKSSSPKNTSGEKASSFRRREFLTRTEIHLANASNASTASMHCRLASKASRRSDCPFQWRKINRKGAALLVAKGKFTDSRFPLGLLTRCWAFQRFRSAAPVSKNSIQAIIQVKPHRALVKAVFSCCGGNRMALLPSRPLTKTHEKCQLDRQNIEYGFE